MPLQLSGSSGVLDNSGAFIAGTAVASTSGTSIDYTSIPSWVKRVTILINGVSTNGASGYVLTVQIGSGSFTTSGYLGTVSLLTSGAGVVAANMSTGHFLNNIQSNVSILHGKAVIELVGSNKYVITGVLSYSDGPSIALSASSITIGGALDRVRLTTSGGTDVFDAGLVNITYE